MGKFTYAKFLGTTGFGASLGGADIFLEERTASLFIDDTTADNNNASIGTIAVRSVNLAMRQCHDMHQLLPCVQICVLLRCNLGACAGYALQCRASWNCLRLSKIDVCAVSVSLSKPREHDICASAATVCRAKDGQVPSSR